MSRSPLKFIRKGSGSLLIAINPGPLQKAYRMGASNNSIKVISYKMGPGDHSFHTGNFNGEVVK
jgi:tRNA A22 N-methylase